MSVDRRAVAVLAVCCWLVARGAPARAAGELRFATTPAMPTLTAVTINGQAQTAHTTMTGFAVADTRGTKSGWNLTVGGNSGTGKSAVFAQYCPKAKCGSSSEGYVAGGASLAADSLTLNTTGAKLSGGTGSAPSFQCSAGCNVDSASAVKIVSAATGGAGEGTWTASGFSATSLALAVQTTMKALPSEEVYRVNLLWTLSSGP